MPPAADLSVTHTSLLARLRADDRDPDAWRTFVDRYGRRVYEWCLLRRLQPADAEDVTQEVLAKLARRLGEFEYDPQSTFRGWLRRVTENAITDFLRERRVASWSRLNEDGHALLDQAEARSDLAARLEEAFDLELLDMAKARVQARVEPHRWQAWMLTTLERQSGERVASRLGMKVASVYSSRYQVQKLITAELQRLEQESTSRLEQVRSRGAGLDRTAPSPRDFPS